MNSNDILPQNLVSDVFIIKPLATFDPTRRIPLEGIEYINALNEKGKPVEISKKYEGNTLYGSQQKLAVTEYSLQDSCYVVDLSIFQGGTAEEKMVDFQNTVRKCELVYEDKQGNTKSIVSCNLADIRDPFINHERMKLQLDDLENSFDLKDPINKIKLSFLKNNEKFYFVESEDLPDFDEIPYTVEFLILRKSPEANAEIRKAGDLRSMLAQLDKLDFITTKMIAQIWDINMDANTSENMLKDQIAFHLSDKKYFINNDNERVYYDTSFKNLVNRTNAELQVSVLVKEGRKLGALRSSTAGFEIDGTILGLTLADVERELNNPENSRRLELLRQRIEHIKKSGRNS